MRIRLGIAATALSALMLAGCSSAPAAPTTVTKEAPAVVLTVTATPTEAATTADNTTADITTAEATTPADDATSDEMTPVATTPEDPTTEQPAASPKGWTITDMTGLRLQVAQDQVQVLSGNPMFVTDSTDATGAGRAQLNDSNWQVCSQTPLPGTTITANTKISFATVKLTESCP